VPYHDCTWESWRYSSTHSSQALGWSEWPTSHPSCFLMGKQPPVSNQVVTRQATPVWMVQKLLFMPRIWPQFLSHLYHNIRCLIPVAFNSVLRIWKTVLQNTHIQVSRFLVLAYIQTIIIPLFYQKTIQDNLVLLLGLTSHSFTIYTMKLTGNNYIIQTNKIVRSVVYIKLLFILTCSFNLTIIFIYTTHLTILYPLVPYNLLHMPAKILQHWL
jgi:hypothetical protein